MTAAKVRRSCRPANDVATQCGVRHTPERGAVALRSINFPLRVDRGMLLVDLQSGMLDRPMKECPDCKAEIRADAKVWRYCQHRFGGRGRTATAGGVIALAAAAIIAIGVAPRNSRRAGTHAQPPAVSSVDATAAGSSPQSAYHKIQALLVRQAKLDDGCRAGHVTIASSVCKQRDDVDGQLSRAGWC